MLGGTAYIICLQLVLSPHLLMGAELLFIWTGSEDEIPNIWEPCLSPLYKMAQDVHPSASGLATALTGLSDRYVPLGHSQGNRSSAQRQRYLITQRGNQVDNSDGL